MDIKKQITIDINVDVGEGIGNEAALMPYISSCNIACGGHAGDTDIMNEVLSLAKKHDVKIGAHPSFPDKVNFGRKPMTITFVELFKSLEDQVNTLKDIAQQHQLSLHHIKAHGALYNLAATNVKYAQLIIELINSIDGSLKLYAPFRSTLADLAVSSGIKVCFEAFADRNYNSDLTLVNRSEANALILEKTEIAKRVYNMISHQKVRAISGEEIKIKTDTICVHGDSENAVDIIKYLHQHLTSKLIKIQ
ncbi:5-oxoprolinase subunit PxpA [Paucihalobacter sp.]|uniref:5-oxoprolinase subunit PxpA n=1 Tax=Paucihalobacter sp. TaxID=2850405 RepID=UPI002FE05532